MGNKKDLYIHNNNLDNSLDFSPTAFMVILLSISMIILFLMAISIKNSRCSLVIEFLSLFFKYFNVENGCFIIKITDLYQYYIALILFDVYIYVPNIL